MSYARRHSTNVCPGNRVRYTIKRFTQQRNHNNVNPTLLVNQEHDAYIAIRRRKIVIFSAVEPLQIGLFLDFETKESCALGFSWTLDCERVLAGGVSR